MYECTVQRTCRYPHREINNIEGNPELKSYVRTLYFLSFLSLFQCNENPLYVFPEKELRGLSPNLRSHVSVNDLHIPRIGPHIFLQQNRQTDCGNI
jgi:hypothetical protein